MSKIGITCSSFDLFHPGHIDMLRQAKEQCDYLIAALQTGINDRPDKNKPIQSVYERYMQLEACKYVDKVIPYESEKDLENLLHTTNIDIRIIGEEYRPKQFTGRDICVRKGIEIFYNKRQHDYSTSGLRDKIYEIEQVKRNK